MRASNNSSDDNNGTASALTEAAATEQQDSRSIRLIKTKVERGDRTTVSRITVQTSKRLIMRTGRCQRQYGPLFAHDPWEVWLLVVMHNSLPVLIHRLVENIQEILEQN